MKLPLIPDYQEPIDRHYTGAVFTGLTANYLVAVIINFI